MALRSLSDSIHWLPAPQQWQPANGSFTFWPGQVLVLPGKPNALLQDAARRVQDALARYAAVQTTVLASKTGSRDSIAITWQIGSSMVEKPQGYQLTIAPEGIKVCAYDTAGAYYAACTLVQLIRQFGGMLPCGEAIDWPDFPVRGVVLDISRGKVPTMETLFHLVDWLAGLKLNHLQLYMEHTFGYRDYGVAHADASPMTGDEILTLDKYCRERLIELVPNQNSFGHLQEFLKYDEYKHLAVSPNGFVTPEGMTFTEPWSLDPLNPASLDLLQEWYDELVPHFQSTYLNVGGDEPYDLDQGPRQDEVKHLGKTRVYLNFLQKTHELVKQQDSTMMIWGDIITTHPELIPELPRDWVVVEWGYEADHPFEQNCLQFAAAGIPFYVCAGISNWNSIAGRTTNALENMRNAAVNGLANGAAGVLSSSWGDYGHWDPLPVTYCGFAYGASVSWACKVDQTRDLSMAVSLHAFDDPTGHFGQLAMALGDVYRAAGVIRPNESALCLILREGLHAFERALEIGIDGFARSRQAIQEAMRELPQVSSRHPEAVLMGREFAWAARLLLHACALGELQLSIIAGDMGTRERTRELAYELRFLMAEYRELWLMRYRIGGLEERSMPGFRNLLKEYTEYAKVAV